MQWDRSHSARNRLTGSFEPDWRLRGLALIGRILGELSPIRK
jgi:hypothetical protein